MGALAVAACASEIDDTSASEPISTSTTVAATSTSTTVAPSTTETPTTSSTTTTVVATTTTAAAPTTTAPSIVYAPDLPVTQYPPGPLPGSNEASGSGCSPGAGPLPNGVWFGLAHQIEPDHIAFDLACFYFGDIAYTEGALDGEEVNNDYYIRNANPALRDVPLVDPTVWTLGAFSGGGDEPFAIDYINWPLPGNNFVQCPSDWCTVWLYVNEGLITEVVEQYLP